MGQYHSYVYKKQAKLEARGIKASLKDIQKEYELRKKPAKPCHRSEFNPDTHVEIDGKRYKKRQ
jgi:hypothetical protein